MAGMKRVDLEAQAAEFEEPLSQGSVPEAADHDDSLILWMLSLTPAWATIFSRYLLHCYSDNLCPNSEKHRIHPKRSHGTLIILA